MIRRPLCLVWVLCMVLTAVLKLAGAPVFGEPSLSGEAGRLIASDDSFSVTGTIESRRESRAAMQYILTDAVIQHHGTILTSDDRPLTFPRLLVTTEKENVFPIGSAIRCYGDVQRIGAPGNPGQFDAESFYRAKGLRRRMYVTGFRITDGRCAPVRQFLYRVRTYCISLLYRGCEPADAAFLAAVLFGDRSGLGEDFLELYRKEELDEIYIIYTSMVNAIQEETQIRQLLPLKKASFNVKLPADIPMEELALKPSPEAVMDRIVPDYVVGFIYGALVESYSCEQNARMMAMEAATKSAKDMLHELDILYNRARQAAITQEITEVIAGAKAQKRKKRQ